MTSERTALDLDAILALLPILPALAGYRELRCRMDEVSAFAWTAAIWGLLVAVYRRVLDEPAGSTCWELGMVGGEETRVYPLFPIARARGLALRVYYLEVTNDTRVLELRPPLCAVLVAEEQLPGRRPAPPYQHLRHRWSDGRFAPYRAPDSGALASRTSMAP